MTAAKPPSSMGQAALFYARRGWPVFPCRERDETVPSKRPDEAVRTFKAKAPYVPKGLKEATTDAHQIKLWWTRWPDAMIGLPMGVNGCFALDFDPRVDEETGEVFTLDSLKAELEAMIGGPLPVSLAAVTPSDGVHVYLAQPAEGDPIRNRGNLPRHVDVRGLGGYVIAPPSIIHPGTPQERKYRFLRGKWDAEVEQAPPALIEALRGPKRRAASAAPANDVAGGEPAATSPSPLLRQRTGDVEADAVRSYALNALEQECRLLAGTPLGNRDNQSNASGFVIGQLVGAGALSRVEAEAALVNAVRGFGDPDARAKAVRNGLDAGAGEPRDLSAVRANARDRAARRGPSSSRLASRPPAPVFEDEGLQSSRPGDSGENDGGRGRGGDPDEDQTRKCAFLPLTDLGNLERFLGRYGGDFLYVEAWGWLAWDGKRWNRDMANALLGHAVQLTMRAIQEEADLLRASGVPFPPDLEEEEAPPRSEWIDDDDAAELPLKTKARKARTALWYRQRFIARQSKNEGERLDSIVQIKTNGDIVLLSDKVAAWGRTSEGAGHINCIAKLAEARLSAMPIEFDADPLLLNLDNCTLVFRRPEGDTPATVTRRRHRRGDRMTKIGNAVHDPNATCPVYEEFLGKVQPTEDMRDFLDTWAGYNALGLAEAQKMAVFYGEGSNGKGVWVATKAHILGDYAWSTGIETFMDAGRTRKGADASPDLAALAGRRMVYANEPEDNSKFADGLVKSLTSDEPKGGVRELMRPPFELQITFTNTVMANNMPRISTDHGIQRRVQVIPWDVIIPDEEQDLRLKDKLKAEASGILNRMVRGALRYLDEGLTMPEAVKEATREYQAENDLLGGFLELCVARVKGLTVGATPLHRVFAAWQTWAGQLPQTGKAWSPKHLNAQMRRKSFKIAKSSTMQWQDIALRYEEGDFATAGEKGQLVAVERELPPPRRFEGELTAKGAPAPPHPSDDDFLPGAPGIGPDDDAPF